MIPSNPCDGTPLPQLAEPHHRYLTIGQVHELAEAIQPRFRALVYRSAIAGLRAGELAALRVANLNLKTQRLTVTQTAVEQSGRITYGEPKTRAARRTISIGIQLTRILTEHLVTYVPQHNVTHITGVDRSVAGAFVAGTRIASRRAVMGGSGERVIWLPSPQDLAITRTHHCALSGSIGGLVAEHAVEGWR